jgi:hypothetical protein
MKDKKGGCVEPKGNKEGYNGSRDYETKTPKKKDY